MAVSLDRYNGLLLDIKESRDAFYNMSEEAVKARKFLAGHHWPEQERSLMEHELRPALTFNQYAQLVHLVSGTEISNRFEPHYLPRTPEDQGGVDVFNEMVRMFRNMCDAPNEESLAFRDCLNEGLGVTETLIDYTDDPNGRVCTVRVKPDEILWDPNAQRMNLLDTRYIIRGRWVDEDTFVSQWPDKADIFFEAMGGISGQGNVFDLHEPNHVVQVNRSWMYKSNEKVYETKRRRVLLIEKQFWVKSPGYAYMDPQTGLLQFISEEEKEQLQIQAITNGQPPPLFTATERQYKREIWAGPVLIEESDNSVPAFTYNFITGYQDNSEDWPTWYGLFRISEDPQKWANKMLSQIVHIIGTNPKGSVHAEEDALSDPVKAAQDWAKPGAIIRYRPGGISQGKMKIVPPPRLPEAAYQMAEYSLTAMNRLLGVNPYAAGTAEDLKRTASSSVQQLIKQGMMSISPMFDSLRLYRKQIGRVYMHFIKQYIEPGLMVRVVGNPTAPFVQYTKDMAFMNYDVVVEEANLQPSNNMELWTTLTEQGLLQKMVELGMPVPPSIIEIIPGLPRYIKDEWKGLIEQMMQAQQQPQPTQ